MTDIKPYLIIAAEIGYVVVAMLITVRIIMDTRTTSKTLAYLLLILLLPVVGIIIYFFFGVNFRKKKFYSYKANYNEDIYRRALRYISQSTQSNFLEYHEDLKNYERLINLLYYDIKSPLSKGNQVELLINGENKFPKVFEVIKRAKHHIHMEYYIYANDEVGNQLADLLIEKAQEGIQVRFLYDAFGSSGIRRNIVKRMIAGGVEVSAVNPVSFRLFANRINYRDHRKIIIVDGHEGFIGGINVSDRYINNNSGQGYWRDTHVYIKGPGIFYLQFLFLSSWIFSTETSPEIDKNYFNIEETENHHALVQFAAGGPDQPRASILTSTLSAIYAASERVYITTPYFIPSDATLTAIKQAALSGVEVILLVPDKADSLIVNAASYSYYLELMHVGVKIHLYQKGFVHSKTMVVDSMLSMVGTANMDIRSQELNFEVNAVIYDRQINKQLAEVFFNDLRESHQITIEEWMQRNKIKVFFEHFARLLSPLL